MAKYDQVIKLKKLDGPSINKINELIENNPKLKICIQISNTKALSSKSLSELNDKVVVRVLGGYDEKKLGVQKYSILESSVEYSVVELTLILKEIEQIESKMKPSWSDYQKLVFIYERLKSSIAYDPEFEQKSSDEIRSLRGLVTKSTVCAGYAIILKEILDRNNILCDYVSGYTDGNTVNHAWNIVTINGYKYPIDLTWDSSLYRRGNYKSIEFLGQNDEQFRQSHVPGEWEEIKDYEKELSSIDKEYLRSILFDLNKEKKYTNLQGCIRDDNSRFAFSQVGLERINGTIIFRYLYVDVDENRNFINPILLYSTTNIAGFVEKERFGKEDIKELKEKVKNVLFSKYNIDSSKRNNTWFIGGLESKKDHRILVDNPNQIEKDEELSKILTYPIKEFRRSDGTNFVMQYMGDGTSKKTGEVVKRYDVFEVIKEEKEIYVSKNTIYSERDLFNDKRQSFTDEFLSRERLERKSNECGGYVGYYDEHGIRRYSESLNNIFNPDKSIPLTQDEKENENQDIPSFEEAKKYALKYIVLIDEKNYNDIKIMDRDTLEIVRDKSTFDKAMWSNIWLSSAGYKWLVDESVSGITYAFNDNAYSLYDFIAYSLKTDCEKKGNIDTLSLYENCDFTGNKNASEIVLNMFRTDYQTRFINEYFRNITKTSLPKIPAQALYTESYVASLLSQNEGHMKL